MKLKNYTYLTIAFLLFMIPFQAIQAQRKMEKLDRGVVAVRNSSGNFFVSWRYLATDPEDIKFNLYSKPLGGSFTKLNPEPLHVTNFSPTGSAVAAGAELYVKPVINGVEGAASGIYKVPNTGYPASYRSAFMDINYSPAVDGLELHKYSTKFIWPADLDGDGEYDFVVDRLSRDGGTHKIQAYLRTGQLLWTVDMGPNVTICQGQDDMVIAYDMDGDGKAEVVIKSSDGTKFANNKGVFGSTTLDTDNDGIINYFTQTVRNSPQYITVIDGMTGVEKNSIEMNYPSIYNRNNRADFMGDEYNNLNGHMGILYHDGKNPAVGFIYKVRTIAGKHFYFASAWAYNKAGQWANLYNWERNNLDAAEAHGIRVADVDFDGKDELLNLGFGLRSNGELAFNAHLAHGDRFRVGDIDPERPGLETFAIQQNAGSMLGQIIYDAANGEAIKKYYLSAVGDVGRGECMDVDSTRLGYEFWSTMANIYDAKGNILKEGGTPFPNEGVWWDGDLDREQLSAPDGNGFNAMVEKYSHSTKAFGNRLIEFAKMTNWQVNSEYGVRPAFFGDMIGDWREEVILKKRTSTTIDGTAYETTLGFVGFSTDYPTKHRIYCLMQNPAYRMQATTKGYYQSPMTDFYLGYHMPEPPIPPVQEAKLIWSAGSTLDNSSANFVLADGNTKTSFTAGDDIMFDISGENSATIQLPADLAPSKLWAMNPKGKDYTLAGNGKLTGTMDLVKSMYGTFTLNGNHTYTGKTIISEGTLCINGSLSSLVDIRAKGTLMGNAVLNGGITLNPGLNVEGGRLSPGNGLQPGKLGKITINGPLTINGKNNIEIDIIPADSYKNDSLLIHGDLIVKGINQIIINGNVEPGTYSLISWTGNLTGSVDNFNVKGISGLPVRIVIEDKTLKLVVEATRSASAVSWTGATDTKWDYLATNFITQTIPHQETFFVQNDSVLFDDNAVRTNVALAEPMIAKGIRISNTAKTYTFSGAGGIAGNGSLEKTGKGMLDLGNIQSTYTGKTIYTNALVKVGSLNQSSVPGVLGQATTAPVNWLMNDTRLVIDAATSNTDRGMTITGNDTIEISKSNGVVSITGAVTGSGNFIKTGTGQLNLSSASANTYSGETVIKAGTIGLGTLEMNRTGFGSSGKIRMENGSRIVMFNSSSDYNQRPTWYITIPENNSATIKLSSRCAISGTIAGGGTLVWDNPYVRADLVAGGADFTGTINAIGSNPLRITTNTIGFPKANVNLGASVFMGAYSSIGASGTTASTLVHIGALSGDATSSVGAGTWRIGSNNRDVTFNGTITDGATITKVGTGKWVLTNASTCTSGFTVSGGTLEVLNTTGSATGTGTVSVSNAQLSGTGIIGGPIIISANGKIMPGISESAVATLTANGNLSLSSSATTIMKVSTTTNDLLKVSGTLYLGGTLDMRKLSGAWEAGKSYTLFNAPSIIGNFAAIIPETPGENLVWDMSRINNGIIAVALNTALNEVDAASVRVYPQPAKDFCIVEFGALTDVTRVELLDQTGKVLLMEQANGLTNLSLNTANLQPGLYFVRIVNAINHSIVRKVMKM